MVKKLGNITILLACTLFCALPFLEHYRLPTDATLVIENPYHRAAVEVALSQTGLPDKDFPNAFFFCWHLGKAVDQAGKALDQAWRTAPPTDVEEWVFRMHPTQIKDYTLRMGLRSGTGPVSSYPWSFLMATIGLGLFGGLLRTVPQFRELPGIRNNHLTHRSLTRGIRPPWARTLLFLTAGAILCFGFFFMNGDAVWPSLTALALLALLWYLHRQSPGKGLSSKPLERLRNGWTGLFLGLLLIMFYVTLYWLPQYTATWVAMVNPLRRALTGQDASQWFLYGLLYTLAVLVMGVRMIARYRHNRYQVIRTCSVIFFQICFAFLLPEILVRLHQPYFDFKNIWPLDYSFFFDWNLQQLTESGSLGIFMLVWGILLTAVGVPLLTYLYGKRWYCSWVCGCGGLAETLGDPFRHLSDKSLHAWQLERWMIHGVLAFAVLMTAAVLYTYFSGAGQILFVNSYSIRAWYGFLIGSGFAGVVGTGFYPLMGNRVWCRFGCPLAAYLGLVQRFRSRFRITVNGGQCISCGNCSTFCDMGIDVRHYAQRGQDVVRAACVGCGVCASVCPRGVLRLENAAVDVLERASEARTSRL
ncbi:MAG: hypothetical protein RLY31_1357 [Bacteroidota bacterium]|jgi:polyferredoxin